MSSTSGRLRILAAALILCAIALPISRWLLLRTPPPPPEAASFDIKRNYWRKRIKADVADVQAYLALGMMEERRGYSTVALRYLLGARSLGASDADVSGPLGRALLSLARDDEALPELERAAKLRPDDLEAALNLAGLYVMQEQTDAAISLLKRFSDTHPALSPVELRRLAYAQLECNNNAEAKTLAERALSGDAGDIESHGIAARCSLTLKNYPEAKKHAEAMVALSGGDASVRYLYGVTLDALGQKDAAIEQWQQTVAANPAALDAQERLGEAFYQRGDYPAAAKAFEILARRAPSIITVSRIAQVYSKLKDRERAAYWRAIQVGLAGDFPSALVLGKIAAASKDPAVHRQGLQAMAEAYRGLRQKEPYLAIMRELTAKGDVADLLLLASAYQQLDRHEERAQCLLRANEMAPETAKGTILYKLAQAYQGRGMRDEAEKALEEAAAREPKQAAYFRELAQLYFERRALDGRLAKAIQAWATTIALDAEESSDWQNLGVAYAEAGELAKAAATLEHAVDLEPGNGPAYLELGRVSAKLGDKESVKRYNALYAKYVAFDQQRQTLRTRANRPAASAADLIAYGDLLLKMTVLDEAAQQYEKALRLTPKDAKLRGKLSSLYIRLRQPEKQAAVMAGGRR